MRFSKSTLAVLACLFLLASRPASAWNPAGHRVVASIAYRQLDDATKARVADVLRKHPAATDLWANRRTNGPDANLNFFWNAAIFPDEARRAPWDKYNRPQAHYVNYRIYADKGNQVEPPLEGENVLNSYVAHLRKTEDSRTSPDERALHVSWIFHQAGDIHMPLHAVARFTKPFPEGDRGGNMVGFPNPTARTDRGNNLHAYWDDLIGNDETPAVVEQVADRLISEFPRDTFSAVLGRKNIRDWAEESVAISLKTVYNNLDPSIARFTERPVGYDADAKNVARRQAALAGYRLGDELKRLFPAPK